MIAARHRGTEPVLLFTFHGTGADERQLHDVGQQLLPGAQVVSPRGGVSENGLLRFFRRHGEGVYDMEDLAARTEEMAAFMEREAAEAGAGRTLGIGYSNGANILASVLFARPDLLEAAVLMHPLIPFTPPDAPGLSGRRVLITAGQRDPLCPPPLTMRLSDWLESQEAQVTLHWHAGGHEVAPSEWQAAKAFLA